MVDLDLSRTAVISELTPAVFVMVRGREEPVKIMERERNVYLGG